jgi:RNA polymerase sigma-70 factor (ECF subfamily)
VSRDAFVSCYRQNVDFVWRLARALGVEATHVDDIVHEAFMVVQRKLSQRDPHESLRPWLAGITRNLVLHHHRSRAREARRLVALAPPLPPREPDEALGLQEAASLMQRFIDGLTPRKREVFVLMEIEGLPAPEVARLLDAKLPTVYSRLHAAREELAAFTEGLRRRDAPIPARSRHA